MKQCQIACIRIPNFYWEVEVTRRLSVRSMQVLIAGYRSQYDARERAGLGNRIVLDCSPDLSDVKPGMPLCEAISRHKSAVIIDADLPFYSSTFDEMLSAIERVVPDVEDGGTGLAYVGISGLEKLYGSDAQVVHMLAEAVSVVSGFNLHVGVAQNKWLAYLASFLGKPGSGRKVTGKPGRFLARFPVDLLPVSYKTVKKLHSFGLIKMGDIADLRQGPMEAQFGSVGRMVWKLSNGIDDRQLVPRKTIEVVSEHLTFQDSTISIPAILSAIESLLYKAFNHPQMQNCYARQASLQAQVFRRAPWTMCVAFKESTGSKDRMFFAIKAKLERVDIPGPLEDMRLTLSGLCGEVWRQESMWEEVKQKTHLREAMNQLQVRLGVTPPIYQVREVDPWSRIPERRHVLVHLDP